ncbi:DUF3617 domain-containing protein [Erythrobacter sp. MTPC3]|uniref:DUF3617 domain-containing protein n=1 Tax=Erythrobacter sp. MTPC3 TaxID=3056564 RepID=UPI0036F37256
MRIQMALIAASALALTACGSPGGDADSDGDGVVTAEEAQALNASAADEIKPLPGKYKVDMQFVKAEGLPEEMQSMMGSSMTNSTEFCLTPEMADSGFGQMAQQDDDSCTIDRYVIDGNDMDMAMSCSPAGTPTPMEMTMSGTVSPTKSDMTMVSKGMFPGMAEASVEMRVTQERIGDCDG